MRVGPWLLVCCSACASAAAQGQIFPGESLPLNAAGPFGVDAVAVDLDGDALLDLVAGDVMLDVAGPALPAPSYTTARSTAFADLNGDGSLDAVAPIINTTNVGVRLGDGAGGFAAPLLATAGSVPRHPATGDFDHDGNVDVAVCLNGAAELAVLYGDGTGKLRLRAKYPIPFSAPEGTLVRDLDNDGWLDVIALAHPRLVGLFGRPPGDFAAAVDLAPPALTWTFMAADLDQDGDDDLVVPRQVGSASELARYVNDGTGAFLAGAPVPYANPLLTQAGGIMLAHLDSDANVDAVVTHIGDGHGRVFRGTSGGAFLPPLQVTFGSSPGSPLALDRNGEGHADVAMVQNATIASIVSLTILLGDGTGGLYTATPVTDGTAHASREVEVADLNTDGIEDVVSRTTAQFDVLLGSPGGGFAPPANLPASGGAFELGDVTGDGNVDIVALENGGITVRSGVGDGSFLPPSFSGIPATKDPHLADVDQNGFLDLAFIHLIPPPFSSYLPELAINSGIGGFSPGGYPGATGNTPQLAPGDFNGDGIVDLLMGASTPSLVLGTGGGAFAPPALVGAPLGEAQDLIVVDWNDDGALDFTASVSSSATLATSLGTGTGTFLPPSFAEGSWNVGALAVGPVDDDAIPDLIGVSGDALVVLPSIGNGMFGPVQRYSRNGSYDSLALVDENQDGRLDVLTSDLPAPGGPQLFLNALPPAFEESGAGCAGTGGFTPRLELAGVAAPGGAVTVRVRDGLGGALSLLLIGAGPIQVPTGGSCVLLVGPLLGPVPHFVLGGTGAGNGTFQATAQIPPATPTMSLSLQAFVLDPGTPHGHCATQRVTIHL